jgi:hypothetical protein
MAEADLTPWMAEIFRASDQRSVKALPSGRRCKAGQKAARNAR